MDLVVWSGPVAPFQVPGATVPGAQEKFFTCRGDVTPDHPHCPSLANSWLDGAGRRIPQMLAKIGVKEADVDNLFLGAFSAGGSIVKRLLEHPADRAMVKAVMLADASYTSGPTAPHAIEGYVRYMDDLTKDPSRLFVATSSASPNKTYGSASDTMAETMQAASARSGVAISATPAMLPVSDQPEHLERLTDNVVWADYGMKGGGHGYHPQIAPEYWQQVLQPWLHGQTTEPPGPGSPPVVFPPPPDVATPQGGQAFGVVVSFLAGTAAGYALVDIVDRIMRSKA